MAIPATGAAPSLTRPPIRVLVDLRSVLTELLCDLPVADVVVLEQQE
jgi:hypothetical protein